jgi:peptidyl-tRNA hydrolase
VLSDFTPDEKQAIIKVLPKVSEAILCLLTEGLTAAMNKHN